MPWLKILKYGAPILLLLGVIYGIYRIGSNAGANEIQKLWDAQVERDRVASAKVLAENAKAEVIHRHEDTRIANDLSELETTHAGTVARLDAERNERLRLSRERASVYNREAESGAAGSQRLASHAAELDHALEEGRGLVRELSETVGQRDEQLKLLADQINNDRSLLEITQ